MNNDENEPNPDGPVNASKHNRVGDDYSRGPNPSSNSGGDIATDDSAVPPREDRSASTDDPGIDDLDTVAWLRRSCRAQGDEDTAVGYR